MEIETRQFIAGAIAVVFVLAIFFGALVYEISSDNAVKIVCLEAGNPAEDC